MRHFGFGPTLTMSDRSFKGLRGRSGKLLDPPLIDAPVNGGQLTMPISDRGDLGQRAGDPLTRSNAAAHHRARAILGAADAELMDAVVWLSAHLTAMERVVYPVMAMMLPEQRTELERQRASARRMQRGLRALEERCAGDGMRAGQPIGGLRDRVLALMDDNVALEQALLAQLVAVLDDQAVASLAGRYEQAARHGPTRPHPHGPRRGRLGRATYALDTLRDHVLDVLDSRHIPLPQKAVRRRKVGRWGYYLLGVANPKEWPQPRRASSGRDATVPRGRR